MSQSLPAQSRPDEVFVVIDSLHSLHPPWIKPRTFGANQAPLGTSLVMKGALAEGHPRGERPASESDAEQGRESTGQTPEN